MKRKIILSFYFHDSTDNLSIWYCQDTYKAEVKKTFILDFKMLNFRLLSKIILEEVLSEKMLHQK